jgi:hypothetical protein
VPLGPGGAACYPFCRMSGLKDPVVPLYPAAQAIASPGAVETDVSTLGLPWFGLVTVAQAVPFQFSVSVCAEAAPAGGARCSPGVRGAR